MGESLSESVVHKVKLTLYFAAILFLGTVSGKVLTAAERMGEQAGQKIEHLVGDNQESGEKPTLPPAKHSGQLYQAKVTLTVVIANMTSTDVDPNTLTLAKEWVKTRETSVLDACCDSYCHQQGMELDALDQADELNRAALELAQSGALPIEQPNLEAMVVAYHSKSPEAVVNDTAARLRAYLLNRFAILKT